jgi:hypothetical protein
MGWSLSAGAMHEIEGIIRAIAADPVGREFMAPPPRAEASGASSSAAIQAQL